MDTLTSQLSSWAALSSTVASNRAAPPSAALDFFASIATSNIKIFPLNKFKTNDESEANTIGRGGFAVVERGTGSDNEVVAVKHSRLGSKIPAADDAKTFERRLHEACLELRILSHLPIKSHPNIVDIHGACLGEDSGRPRISLILEFAQYGNLYAFLTRSEHNASIDDLMDLITQVTRGLDALHNCNICHGDIKTRNVLIFGEGGGRRTAKLADFGHAVVASEAESATVELGWGTRLLNAPEIRKGIVLQDKSFTIQKAIKTDLFSFGLLVWEVMKNGGSFFDTEWLPTGDDDDEAREEYLNNLPINGLLDKAIEFGSRLLSQPRTHATLRQIFSASLQDAPDKRWTATDIRKHLETKLNHEQITTNEVVTQPLSAWSREMSVADAYTSARTSRPLQMLPLDLQKSVLRELEMLASCSAVSPLGRGHSAMCASECYVVGFGASHDGMKILSWILRAAEEECYGYLKLWYHRLCSALGLEPISNETTEPGINIEKELTNLPPELYLINRIHLYMRLAVFEVNKTFGEVLRSDPAATDNYQFELITVGFGSPDQLLPIHVAAFIGDDKLLLRLSDNVDINSLSGRGLNAAHYACMGGHYSTLEILVGFGIRLTTVGIGNVSLVHLCVFFKGDTAVAALNLLSNNGADCSVETTESIYLWFHDIRLHGTPLHWAVEGRHAPLVTALLPSPHAQHVLGIAIRRNFWDIVECILVSCKTHRISVDVVFLAVVERPFAHWIAHGSDRKSAIERTIRLCRDRKLIPFITYHGSSLLQMLLTAARTEDDFAILEACLDIFPRKYLTEKSAAGRTVFDLVIDLSKNRPIWEMFLVKLARVHTIEELEQERDRSTSYLHDAVVFDSVIATRVLLERGVNVSQPTFDMGRHTPLHLCFARGASPEIYKLLIKHGADITKKAADFPFTPLQFGFVRGVHNFDLLTLGLENAKEREDVRNTLHWVLWAAVEWESTEIVDYMSPLRLVLGWGEAASYLDSTDDLGFTLVQRAAYSLHADCVSLLLETSADASLGFASNVLLLPLEIACRRGRLCWFENPAKIKPTLARATAVVNELLNWHHSRKDGWFQGITRLHLAAFMRNVDEIKRLIVQGYDVGAKGDWPGIDTKVDPFELMTFAITERGEHTVRLAPGIPLCPDMYRGEVDLLHIAAIEGEIRDLLHPI